MSWKKFVWKMLFYTLIAGIIAFGAIVGIDSLDNNSTKLSGEIDIAGSSTVYPITTAMAEEFSKEHPNVTIPVKSTGTGGGFNNFFCVGKADINNASREITKKELEKARKNDIVPVRFKIGYDVITVVANPKAKWVDKLTAKQLAKIWRPNNHAKKWSDLNPKWPDHKIKLYGPTSASGTFDWFTEQIIGRKGVIRTDYQKTERDNTIVQAVATEKYALGYLGMAYYYQNRDRLKKVNRDTNSDLLEKLMRPLFIYMNKDSLQREAISKFVEFYLNHPKIVEQVGYLTLDDSDIEKGMEKLGEFV